ncbi:MAG: sulfatase-like hydrolase/transferase [Planctomycetaceae bacterium]|nr:sulfatase-like hydrolase/transferase [Planctomycetaceae bacterium]
MQQLLNLNISRLVYRGLLLTCFALIAAALQAAEMPQRPNIVTVFIDDMGWSDLSCFNGTRTTTEHIDQLAAEGIRFTNFYVNSPICSPSRVALSTGQYPFRWRINSYLAHREHNDERGVAQWLDLDAPMLARELHKSGYATGHFGKWHMGGQRDVGEAPLITEYGFDASLTNFEGLGPRVLPLKDAYNGRTPQRHDLGSANLGRGLIRWEDRSVVTTAFIDDALKFIDESQQQNKPFFVNLWPDDVHSPFFPPKVLRDKTNNAKRELYYAVLDAMDQQFAKLFDRIRNDEKLKHNTVILVMSDNGHEEGAGSADPLRGAKTWLYEGGIRSPLIVWGPGFLKEDVIGTTNNESVLCALDVNRSLYSLAGIEPAAGKPLDGEDLLPTLLGKEQQSRRAPIFWRRPPDRPGTKEEDNPDLAVRDGQWKYMVNYDGSIPQLYDLHADQIESKNLAEQHPDIVARLHKAVTKWNATLPQDAGNPEAATAQNAGPLPDSLFVNPIAEGADPWVVRDPNEPRYLWCLSEGNRAIAIHASDCLNALGPKHIVWTAPETGPYSKEIWAPELHFLDGHWYIYFAASDGNNANHLTYVLESNTNDPLGDYTLHGPLKTGAGENRDEPNIWAIDMTVLQHGGKRYAIWSGWDEPGSDRQYLYAAEMASPTKLTGPRVRLCNNSDYLWERLERDESQRGLHEGPEVFQSHGSTYLMYSCAASWLPTYKLGMLKLVGENPLNPEDWQKQSTPAFNGTESVYGVGHSCFVYTPEDDRWWHVFHAKRDRNPGWRRSIHVQPMGVGPDGEPLLGQPINPGSPLQLPAVPKGAAAPSETAFDYYGHHQFYSVDEQGIHLGTVPEHPVNDYRCGEKIIFRRPVGDDFQAAVTIDFGGDINSRDAGILFRCTGPAVGYDAQHGYFAGLIPKTGLVIFGKMDGHNWKELARAETTIDSTKPQRLEVKVQGDKITILQNGEPKIEFRDATYTHGSIGLRVVNTEAVFSEFEVGAE